MVLTCALATPIQLGHGLSLYAHAPVAIHHKTEPVVSILTYKNELLIIISVSEHGSYSFIVLLTYVYVGDAEAEL